MRTLYHVSVNEADIEPSRLRELLDKADVEAETISKPGTLGVYAATIVDDMLGDVLRRNGVDSFLRQSRIQSDDEILAAPLAAVRIDRAPSGQGGPRYGTTFTLEEACPRCGTGARPVGDVVLRVSDVPKKGDVFETLDGERFVSDRVRDALLDADVPGGEFHAVRAARTGESLPWSQVIAPF